MRKLLVLLWGTFVGTIFLLFIIDMFPSYSTYFNKIISQDKRFLHAMSVVFSLSALAFIPYLEIVYLFDFKIKRLRQDEKERLYPLLQEVLDKSNKIYNTNYSIDKMFIRMIYDDDENALAAGKRIVVVYTGLLTLSDDEIKGILAHEIGHLHNKDGIFNLAIWFVLFPYNLFMKCYNIAIIIFNIFIKLLVHIPGIGLFFALISFCVALASRLFVMFDFVIVSIFNFLDFMASRKREYAADKFAADLGYNLDLASALNKICYKDSSWKIVAWFKELWSTHPQTVKRINRLNSYSKN